MGLTDEEIAQVAALTEHVRRHWKDNPGCRADIERAVHDAVAGVATRAVRRAGGRCEHCGSPDKDAVIARLEQALAGAERTLGRVAALADCRRKTVRAGDLRAALGIECLPPLDTNCIGGVNSWRRR